MRASLEESVLHVHERAALAELLQLTHLGHRLTGGGEVEVKVEVGVEVAAVVGCGGGGSSGGASPGRPPS